MAEGSVKAPWEMDWSGGGGKAASATAAPWEMDWGGGEQAQSNIRAYSLADGNLVAALDPSEYQSLAGAKEGDTIQTSAYGPVTITKPVTRKTVKRAGGIGEEITGGEFISPKYQEQDEASEAAAAKEAERLGPVGAAITSGLANIPGAAGGMAGVGYVGSLPAVQSLPPIPRTAATLAGGFAGAIGTNVAARPIMSRILPLDEAEKYYPTASAIGAAIGEAPVNKIGTGVRLAERALGATIAGGIQTGTEFMGSGPEEGALARVGSAAAAGALFARPTRLGQAAMDLGASAAPRPSIVSQLGNVEAKKGTALQANKSANEISMAPIEPAVPPTPTGVAPEVVGAPEVINSLEGFGQRDPRPKPKLKRVRGLAVESSPDLTLDPEGGRLAISPHDMPFGGPQGPDLPTLPVPDRPGSMSLEGFQPVELKAPMEFEGVPRRPEAQFEEQANFNKRVADVTSNLKNEGVTIDRKTAVELARITNPQDFNVARQKLIDAGKQPEPPKVPKKGPIKSLEDLPGGTPQKKQVPVDRVPTLNEVSEMTGPEFNDYYQAVTKAGKEDRGMTNDAVQHGKSAEGSPEKQAVLKKAEEAASAAYEAAKAAGDFDAAMGLGFKKQFFREAYESATKTGGFTPELTASIEGRAKALATPEPAPAPAAKPARAPKVQDQSTEDAIASLKKTFSEYEAMGKRVAASPDVGKIVAAVDAYQGANDIAIDMAKHPLDYPAARRAAATKKASKLFDQAKAVAEGAGFTSREFWDILGARGNDYIKTTGPAKAVEPPKTEPPVAPEATETAKVKVGDVTHTITKRPDGGWYDAEGNQLSGGSRQFAIQKLKDSLKAQSAKPAKKTPEVVPLEERAAKSPTAEEAPAAPETAPETEFLKPSEDHPRKAELEAAIDKVDEFDLDPEAKKSSVVAMAKKLNKQGLIDEANLNEVARVAKDRDMGVEDVASELKSALYAERAKGGRRGINKAGERGSVLNPFDNLGEPTEIGRRALARANEPLLERMATADVEATNQRPFNFGLGERETTQETGSEVEFPQPGEGRAQTRAEKKALESKAYDTSDLLPVEDSITKKSIQDYRLEGKEPPKWMVENEKKNAETIFKKLQQGAQDNLAAPPPREVADTIAKVPEHFKPFFTDIASRMPTWMTKVPGIQTMSDAVGFLARGARKLGTIEGNIRDYDPETAGALREKALERSKMLQYFWSKSDGLGELARKTFNREEFNKYEAAAFSGDRDELMKLFNSKDNAKALIEAFESNQAAKQEIRQMLLDSGMEVGEVETFFRRRVIDRNGLKRALGADGVSAYKDALRARGVDAPLSAEEEVKAINDFILGSIRNKGKPGWLKPRTIERVTENLVKFYESSDVADHHYFIEATRQLSNRKWFGKAKPPSDKYSPKETPIEGSFGDILRRKYRSGAISDDGFNQISKNLHDYFVNNSRYDEDLGKVANFVRKIQTYGYLADAVNAIMQFADIFNVARRYGWNYAATSYGKKPFSSLEDIGIIEGGNPDILQYRRGRANNPVSWSVEQADKFASGVMKQFIGRADRINKGAIGKAAFEWVQDVIKKPSSEAFKRLDAQYKAMYPEKWPKMLEDLKDPFDASGNLKDGARDFLYNEVANLQPIDAAQRSQLYNSSGPLGKLLFTLRSFALRQLDVLRKDVYENLKRGNHRDGLLGLATYLAYVGIGQQLVNFARDKVLGRDVENWTEYGVNGVLQLAMVPRYAFYRAKESSIVDAAIDTTIPGLGIGRDIWKDSKLAARYFFNHRDSQGRKTARDVEDVFKQSRTVQYLPGAGREIYWWFGRGREQEKRAERDRAQGKKQKPTIEMISELFFEPDLKSPRRD